MKAGYADITFILDRSGSMGKMEKEAVDGFNRFVADQRQVPGEAVLTLFLFNSRADPMYSRPLSDVPELTLAAYAPRDLTALYDAVGTGIMLAGERFQHMAEQDRPEKVIFAILTDGEENASRKWNHDQIAEMIKHQQEVYSWEFIFLGANMDAPAVAQAMNIPVANAMNFAPSGAGVTFGTQTISSRITRSRTSQ